jgi:thiol-disulfide isomerase/thioredoxin
MFVSPQPVNRPSTSSGRGRSRALATHSRALSLSKGALVTLIILVLAALAGCSADSSGQDSQTGSENGYVGGDQQLTRVPVNDRKPAPTVSGPSVSGSGTVSSKGDDGKVIVVNIWGSWCPPCRKEAPDLQAASEATADTARFIGIDSRDPGKAAAQAFVRAFGITYPSIYDPDGSQVVKFTDLPPSAIPSTLVIDKQGRVAVRILGTITKATLIDIVEDVAAGR